MENIGIGGHMESTEYLLGRLGLTNVYGNFYVPLEGEMNLQFALLLNRAPNFFLSPYTTPVNGVTG